MKNVYTHNMIKLINLLLIGIFTERFGNFSVHVCFDGFRLTRLTPGIEPGGRIEVCDQ